MVHHMTNDMSRRSLACLPAVVLLTAALILSACAELPSNTTTLPTGGQLATAQLLFDLGADPTWVGYDDRTALAVAEQNGAAEVVRWLEGVGARPAPAPAVSSEPIRIDHVDGLHDLCSRFKKPVKVFTTAPQLDTWTLFTAEGRDLAQHAGCTAPVRIGGAPLRVG